MIYKDSEDFAKQLDIEDPLGQFREQFYFPEKDDKQVLYFTGNSLGLQPISVRNYVEQELSDWETLGVEGHLKARNPWLYYHKYTKELLSGITGAKPLEVVSMNSLTVNLHLMLVSFYQPDNKKYKIITEAGNFPSDQYALETQIKFRGLNPDKTLIELTPREGEYILRTEDIISAIEDHSDELALVMMSGVQYFTGQFFNLKKITDATHRAGAFAGFDLAHAVGNVPLSLHEDDVDFAVWCSYKYLNSGPGNVSGIFVHENHNQKKDLPRFAGWWGYDEADRFKMEKGFSPMDGADGWQLSNVNVISTAAHLASLKIFEQAGMQAIRDKSVKLTGYLEFLIKELYREDLFKIITPEDPEQRGCQISLLFERSGKDICYELEKKGVIVDWREPGVMRMAPVPLYNSYSDVYHFAEIFKSVLNNIE